MTYLLGPLAARLSALQKGVTAMADGIAEFFSLLPCALASGAADTMAAHGRDPNAGIAHSFSFDAVDADDWDEEMEQQWEMHSYHRALNGIVPTDLKHLSVYNAVRLARDRW